MANPVTLSPARERLTLSAFAAIQFTHVLDFMVMMPLGAQLMRVFQLSPSQFSHVVAVYGLSAAVSGVISGAFLDRIPRRSAFLFFYAGFIVATLCCALAPSFGTLLLARAAAGAFGGVASSLVTALVGDLVPAERRGRAIAWVMTSFPLASVLGIPLSLWLTQLWSWHAPFLLLASLGILIWWIAQRLIPAIPLGAAAGNAWTRMSSLVTHPINAKGLVVTLTLVMAGNAIIPFFAPSLVANAGLPESQLAWIYFAGGIATLITTPLIGRASDRYDKVAVIAWMSLLGAGVIWVLTRLGPSPLWLAMAVTAAFMVAMTGRFGPTLALISNAIEPSQRGGYMAINSAVMQAGAGMAHLLAGFFVTRDPVTGRLEGMPLLSWVSIGILVAHLLTSLWLRRAAPHAAKSPMHTRPPFPPEVMD